MLHSISPEDSVAPAAALSDRPSAPPAPQPVSNSQHEGGGSCDRGMMVNLSGYHFPTFAEKVSQREKRGGPEERAGICVCRKVMGRQVGDTRRVSREMADARYEIAECQPPVADPLEPLVRLVDVFLP